MMVLGPLGFAAPWILLGLLALPILWLILRAVPPAPVRRLFPGVALLLGLKDDDNQADRTPWWLLLLRMLAIAAIIIGLAGPVLNPERETSGSGPLLVVLDSSWAGATSWQAKMDALDAQLSEAGRSGRAVATLELSNPKPVVFQSADALRNRLAGLTPQAWQPSETQLATVIADLNAIEGGFDTHWFTDMLDYPGRDILLDTLEARGDVVIYQSQPQILALAPARFADGAIQLGAYRSPAGAARDVAILAHGLDPSGAQRILATARAEFEEGSNHAQVAVSLPAELRARITRFELQGQSSAGAVTIADDSLRRREVALISGRDQREGLELLSPLHYLEQALIPTADLLDGTLTDLLPANPDVIVMADVATVTNTERDALIEWVDAGGLLVRFAGKRLAASDVSRSEEDPLMPVRLRAGGRTVGGAMSWGEPKQLAPFAPGSPFFGLEVPPEVVVSSQVMAQPDPTLADRVIAALEDGTPLVTRKSLGQGQIVLFHITANAEWSSLPLSGLFVDMLERLAVSSSAKAPEAADLEGTTWSPLQVLDGFGTLQPAGNLPGVTGPDLAEAALGPALQPGLYQSGDRQLARNVISDDPNLDRIVWPARIPVELLNRRDEIPLGGWLLALSLILLAADAIAALALSGRLRNAGSVLSGLVLASVLGMPSDAQNSSISPSDVLAGSEVSLAFVETGDARIDDLSRAGLQGLSNILSFRTSVEPIAPVGVDLETDELAFFPLLYWPITPEQERPSDAAYTRLNAYLRSGGMIVFDTRDADVAGFSTSSANGRKLQDLAASLDIPPLEPVPDDHVLTRTFYCFRISRVGMSVVTSGSRLHRRMLNKSKACPFEPQ